MQGASGKEAVKLLEKIAKERDTVSDLKDKLLKDVHNEMIQQDLSEDKLKNAVALKIILRKFSGYDSELDIYTFKREFGKFIESNVQKKSWSTLTQVQNLDEIEEIWKRLEAIFSDVQFLLHNKLSSLDKIGGLWKVKEDEKLMNVISNLLNDMAELKALVTTHGLSNELYYDSGVEKILYLMDETRKRKFIRKSMGNKLKGPGAWDKLSELLERELSECQKLTLYAKSEQCTVKAPALNNNSKQCIDRKYSKTYNVTTDDHELQCHICGKRDHVVSQQGTHKSIQYFSCKAFAESKPSERLLKLKGKGFCVKCLCPGVRSGHKVACYYQYSCPHKSHAGEDIKLHVLLCESHCKNTENLQLLDGYKIHITERLCPNLDLFSRGIKIINYSNSTYTNVKTGSEDYLLYFESSSRSRQVCTLPPCVPFHHSSFQFLSGLQPSVFFHQHK